MLKGIEHLRFRAELHRALGITYFMAHRIREAMRAGGLLRWAAAAKSLKSTKL
jgi:hypothetical protein